MIEPAQQAVEPAPRSSPAVPSPPPPPPSHEPSAVAWRWRRDSAEEQAGRAREAAAAARRRGALGAAIGLAATLLALAFHRRGLALAVALVALAIAAVAFASPRQLYPRLMRLFELFGRAVGTAVTWLLMVVIYYLLFLPVGLLLRARGKLDFYRFADRRLPSYWTATERTGGAESYRRQF